MELLRALGAVIERPDAAVSRLATALELPAQPTVAEHTFLFEAQLEPRASRYLSATGAPSEAICERTASYWRAAGAAPPAVPDRLPALLGFYADLVDRQGREFDAARRHAVGRLRKVFLWEQLLTWLPAYLTKVDLLAPRAYRRWGQLLWQVAAREAWTVGASSTVPAFLADVGALSEPPPTAGPALVEYLSAPARSGLILVPVDIKRASDALHAPPPPGSLREALAILLERRPTGMLEWLATEARRWEARHERNRDLLPALSDHWMRRARSTRVTLHAWSRASTPGSMVGAATEPARSSGTRPHQERRAPSHPHAANGVKGLR